MLKRYMIAALALVGLVSHAWADTDKLTAADGWTKITSVPTASEISQNYYVFVDATRDLMLGVGKGEHQSTKWYSLGVYYYTSVAPTSASINNMTWMLETQGDGFALRNLEYSVLCFQTESSGPWMYDTNDVPTTNSWTQINLVYANGSWTLQNGKHGGNNYIGPWNDGNFANGAECAANKTDSNVGKFHIYAISRAHFKQNLLDNASSSNPVDVTPWYVTNATFDGGNRTGWTEEGSGGNNNTSYGGGCEIWQRSNFKIYQDLTLPKGTYKVSLQIAGTTGAGQVYGTSGSTTKTVISSAAAGSDYQSTILSMIQNRTYGQVTTDEIAVSNGSLQMGMKCETTDQWLVFDNFKLYCTGLDLSAYQEQLADLVNDCNDFIDSSVVPEACENVISSAITTYNKTYETANEYSAAIVALTNVLNTYQNDTDLQNAYATYYSLKNNFETLTSGQEASSALTTFNTAVSNATTAVEAAITVAAVETQTANLRSAGLTYISSVEGQFDITFLASQNYWDWKKTDGSNAGIVADQYLANRPNTIPSFAENFEWTAATTGNVLYQTVSNLPIGYYQVGMYTMALSTSQRDNIATEATEGDADRSFAFAGNLEDATSIQRTGMPIKFATAVDFDDLTILDVNVHLSSAGALTFGVQKDANGSNWHFAQIASIIYSSTPDLTGLKATRDALVSEAEGLLASSDADLLTAAQQQALQNAISEGNAANTFETLNTVTLSTLPNAINTAKQQISVAKDNRVLMLAALERFENDYNLADGTDYSRVTMSAGAWTTLINKVNAVTTALDDVSQASNYGTVKDELIAQMDATDASLRLFKNYKAMVEGTTDLGIVGSYGADDNMDDDAHENTAITALNTAFVNYIVSLGNSVDMAAFLGDNLDFSAAQGAMIVGKGNGIDDGNYGIFDLPGWEEIYKDYDNNYYIQTANTKAFGKLYIRSNWESGHPTLQVVKSRMLPEGKYKLSFLWNSNMENMDNLSYYKLGETSIAVGKATSEDETLEYEFEVTGSAQPFDLSFGFKRTSEGNAPAQIIVDDVTLTYYPTVATVTFAPEGFATYYNGGFDVTLPAGMKARIVTKGTTDGTLVYETIADGDGEAKIVPAGTAVLLQVAPSQEAQVLEVAFAPATAAAVSQTNWLRGSDSETITAGEGKHYKLTYSNNDDNFGWYWGADSGAAFTSPAHKAWLVVPDGVNAKLRFFGLPDASTLGIESIAGSAMEGTGPWYTLSGLRLNAQPTAKGIYIRNGKKVVVK